MRNLLTLITTIGMLVSLILCYRAEKRAIQTEDKLNRLVGFTEGLLPDASFTYLDDRWNLHLAKVKK